jgi:hypothetical protein
VESADGGKILTDMRMDIYAAWFAESAGKLQNRKPSQVGGKGRKIQGMAVTSVDEMLKSPLCRRELNTHLDKIRKAEADASASSRIRRSVRQILENLDRLEELGKRGETLVIEAARAIRLGLNADRYLRSLDNLDKSLLSGDGRDVISFLIQPVILELSSRDSGENPDPLSSSRRLYREITDSAAYHKAYLRRFSE